MYFEVKAHIGVDSQTKVILTPPLPMCFDEIEDSHLRLGLGLEAAAVQQLAFQRGEEAFAHGVIETVELREEDMFPH